MNSEGNTTKSGIGIYESAPPAKSAGCLDHEGRLREALSRRVPERTHTAFGTLYSLRVFAATPQAADDLLYALRSCWDLPTGTELPDVRLINAVAIPAHRIWRPMLEFGPCVVEIVYFSQRDAETALAAVDSVPCESARP